MNRVRTIILIFSILSFTLIVNAQEDYDFYLQKARQRLAEGDCTRAEISYNSYKDMALKIDKEMEFLIEECKKGGVMNSNPEETLFGDYNKTKTGLYYKFYSINNGALPHQGDLLDVGISCFVNDTSEIIAYGESTMQLKETMFSGDLLEGLALMHKGDSASFIVNIDSTFIYLFDQPTLPPEYNHTDVMRFEVRMDDFYPESEYPQHYAVKINKSNEERIAMMKESYPEETAQAAQELDWYLAKNNIASTPTESGLHYLITEKGNGEKPKVGEVVTMRYTGKLLDGTVFDSSAERDQPFQFVLGVGQVIPGWDEGVQLMTKGEKGVFYIPYYLAYGDRDLGEIPPFSNLIFEVELVDF